MKLRDLPAECIVKDDRVLGKTMPQEHAALPQTYRDQYEVALRKESKRWGLTSQ